MSKILYYSNYCNNCKNLIAILSKTNATSSIHFVCIDKRIKDYNKTYVILENGQQLLLPNIITCVPSLMLIKENYKVLTGDEIMEHFKFLLEEKKNVSTNFNGEPLAFTLGSSADNINSDNYSFLDQDSDELSAKGNGGMRQLYNYATINHIETIETPSDEYTPDKINETQYNDYQSEREKIN
tara:strand:+ start:42 stop:590 length:549 start_codon:yes stop_codon:yes gene_type:complete